MICIFKIKLLNVGTTLHNIFIVLCLIVQSKVSGCWYVVRYWHKRSHGKSKLTQSDALTVKLLQLQPPISNKKLMLFDIANFRYTITSTISRRKTSVAVACITAIFLSKFLHSPSTSCLPCFQDILKEVNMHKIETVNNFINFYPFTLPLARKHKCIVVRKGRAVGEEHRSDCCVTSEISY